jgi:hypothetical protein
MAAQVLDIGGIPSAVALADIDDNGTIDIAATNATASQVSVRVAVQASPLSVP